MTSASGGDSRDDAIRTAAKGATGGVVILSANPIHDTGGGQRSAQLALEFLERDHAVVFVSHGRVTETVDLRLEYDDPRLVQLDLSEVTDRAGAEALAPVFDAGPSLVVTQVPVHEWDAVLGVARWHEAVTAYDCIDRWDSELGRGWYSRGAERDIARGADLLVASAPALIEHVEVLAGREAHLLPNAYNSRLFDPRADHARPSDLPDAERVALYVGALWGGWMDWDLVARSAAASPETAFVFVGDHRNEGRDLPPNCHFLGLKPQATLPPYLAAADLAFIPWETGALTEATSPLKVYEFVAMGLPVVAPAIEPLRGIPGVRTCDSREVFVTATGDTGRSRLDHQAVAAMEQFSSRNSWEERVDAFLSMRDEALGRASRPSAASVRTGAAISVVIPSYNHARFIGAAMDSVRDQMLPAAELVIVDDGSTDASRDVIEDHRFEGVRTVFQENRGAHRALNRAIALSRGEYVAILNSDDLFTPERLEHAWGVVRATGAALLCGSVRLIDEDGGAPRDDHEIARWYREARVLARRAPSLRKALDAHNVAVTTSNFFMHRELWDRLGGFHAFRYVHDYDFLLRAVALCPDRVRYVDALEGVLYRVHDRNTISEARSAAREERVGMLQSFRSPGARVRRFLRRGAAARAVRTAVDRSDALVPQGASPVAVVDEPLDVGITVTSLGTGGLEEIVALLAQSLPAHGVRASVLCSRAGGPVADRLRRAGIPVRVGTDAASWRSWAEEGGLRLVSSHFAPGDVVEALHGAGLPVVETIQNVYAWFTATDWAAEREKLTALHSTIAVSDDVAAYYRKHTGHAPAHVVPNAVHPGRAAAVPRAFARAAIDVAEGVPLFVSVGRVTVQKNPFGLLDAFEHVRAAVPDARLLLVGPADRSVPIGRLKAAHPSLFRTGAVRHMGATTHVGTVLGAADAFVSNSFHEGWSVAASEAAWVGRPVVLSTTGGARELVGPAGERGVLVPNPCGDPLAIDKSVLADPPLGPRAANEVALAEALVSVARDLATWRLKEAEIRAHARDTLAPEVIASRYAAIFRDVARGRPDP